MDNQQTVQYLNTDLELIATTDLASLAQALALSPITAASICCLHVGYMDPLGYHARFEAFGPEGSYQTPEQSINALLSAIEQLDPPLHALWQACSTKTLDIGYRSGIAPCTLSNQLSLRTLARMQVLGIDLSITLYPVDE